MMKKSFSAVNISSEENLGFSASEYSRFKYGSKHIARKFGKTLAEKFFQSRLFHEIACNRINNIVVCASPHHNIPTATSAMKDYFIGELNRKLVDFELDPVSECKIHRVPSYVQDYGQMSAEERKQRIAGDGFYIDKEFVKGKFVIFLDDIKITGAHEDRIQHMIEKFELECDYMYMYFAELVSDTVPPQLEHYLNLNFVKSLLDIDWIIKNDKFAFNTRVVKYMISAEFKEFKNFILYQSDMFRDVLYKYAIANGYHKHEGFQTNLDYLKSLIS